MYRCVDYDVCYCNINVLLCISLVYDGNLLARSLLTELYGVCKDWSSDFPLLKAPVDKVDLSLFAIKNSRRKMEDKFALCVDVNSLYGLKVKRISTLLFLYLYVCDSDTCWICQFSDRFYYLCCLSYYTLYCIPGHATPGLLCCV